MGINFKDGGKGGERNSWEREKERQVVVYWRDGGRVVGNVTMEMLKWRGKAWTSRTIW